VLIICSFGIIIFPLIGFPSRLLATDLDSLPHSSRP
jgi:hypothetical protein